MTTSENESNTDIPTTSSSLVIIYRNNKMEQEQKFENCEKHFTKNRKIKIY